MLDSGKHTPSRPGVEATQRGRTVRAAWANSTAPPLESLEPRLLFTAVPLITEFLASNDDDLLDEDGDDSDWLELFNAGDSALDLTGWHLTDDDGDLTKWTLPSVSLDPGRYLVVFASGKDRADADGTELHTNFGLSAGGEYLALVEADGTTVAFEYAPEYPPQEEDVSYGLAMETFYAQFVGQGADTAYLVPTAEVPDWNTVGFDDTAWSVGPTGLGYENSPGDNITFTSLIETTLPVGTTSVYLRQTFEATDIASFDAFELGVRYDDGFAAYLNGHLIASDNAPEDPLYNALATGSHGDPQAIDFVSIDITEHLDKLVAGTNVLAIQGLNTNNSSDYLIEAELTATGSQFVQPQEEGYFQITTPGGSNGEAFEGFVEDTAFSIERGVFDTAFDLTLTNATPGAAIVYTTDGSVPAVDEFGVVTNGTSYTGPISITTTATLRAAGFKPEFQTARVQTHTYLFLDDVINQTEASVIAQGLPTMWGPFTPDYAVNVAPGSEADFTNALTAIPTISITIDNDELFDPTTGIYTNSQERGFDWERAASIEYINPDGSVGFQEDAGLRIQGGAFRNNSFARKNSFRIAFRDEYGADRLAFPLFGEDAAQTFNTITLRMDSNDSYGWVGAGSKMQYARDEWGRQTQLDLGRPAPHGTRVQLYLNGVYWGMYNPVERPDESFGEDYYGGDADDWDVLNRGGATDGNFQAWDTLVALAQSVADAPDETTRLALYQQILGNHADGTDNPLFEDYLDAENYADYLITNFYGGNRDWPHNNYFMARERGADSTGFKFHMWDSEWTLRLQSNLDTDRTGVEEGVAEPYHDLRNSEEFRVMFGDRAHRALFNDGALTETNAIARYQSILDGLEDPIHGEIARWGDQHNTAGYTFEDWEIEAGKVIDRFLIGRTAVFIAQLQAAGLYSSVEAVAWNQRGGVVGQGVGIELTASAGTIYYTTDGSDPRLLGGALNPNAIEYTGPFLPTGNTTIRARVLDAGVWSAVDQADFILADAPADATNLRITELLYHPADPTLAEQSAGFTDEESFEFIELVNLSATDIIDLTGVRFTAGIDYAFDLGTTLAPGQRITLVNDTGAFAERYGTGVTIFGEFGDKLSNGGEQLTLLDNNDAVILDFTYDDDPLLAWPTSPDGKGPSLVVINPAGDYNDPANWRVSVNEFGSPNAEEGLAGDIDGDGFVGATDLDAILANWGDDPASSPEADAADLDFDDIVGSKDLSIVIANFGQGVAPSQPTSNPGAPGPGEGASSPGDDDAGPNDDGGMPGGEGQDDHAGQGGAEGDGPDAGEDDAAQRPEPPQDREDRPAPADAPPAQPTDPPRDRQSVADRPAGKRDAQPPMTEPQKRAAQTALRPDALALARPAAGDKPAMADPPPAKHPRFDALALRRAR